MNITERVEAICDPTKQWRETVWEQAGLRDAPPSIGYLIEGEQQYGYPPMHILADLCDQAGEDMASVVYTVLKTRAEFDGFTKFRQVIGIFDSYGYDGDVKQAREEGITDLEEDFQTNPASKVTEQVTIIIAADDLVGGVEAAVGLLPYSISDGGQMTWGDLKVYTEDDGFSGVDVEIINAMKWGVLHAHEG